MTRAALRAIAVAIAIGGVVDPVITREGTVREAATIAIVGEADIAARVAAGRLAEGLTADFVPAVRTVPAAGAAAACVNPGPCVLISDGTLPTRVTADAGAAVWAVRLPPPAEPNVAVRGATVAAVVDPAAAARLTVTIFGTGVAGRRTELAVIDSGVTVGAASVEWTEDGVREVPIVWWPLDAGVRALRVSAATTGDVFTDDDAVTVGADVRGVPFRIVVYEPRPSWAMTFARRALEADPRWTVNAIAQLGPGVAVRQGAITALDADAIGDARVVAVGAPEALAAAEVDVLGRFVRQRGGTLLLVPDQRPTGPITRMLRGDWRLRLEASPVQVGTLLAGELLLTRPGPDTTVLAAVGDEAAVTAEPMGRGRVIVSGAMDAWRHRATDDAAFARFWTGLVAAGAQAAGPGVSVAPATRLAAPGQPVDVHVRIRSMEALDRADVEATIQCGTHEPRPLRLWPDGAPGALRGTLRPVEPGECTVTVSTGDTAATEGTARLLVGPTTAPAAPAAAVLDQFVAARGGTVVMAGDEATLAGSIAAAAAPASSRQPAHPFRSPWWLIPFGTCLGGEWYLRRRAGVR